MTGSACFPPSDRSSPADLVEVFAALQSLLLTAQGVDDFLTDLTKLAAQVVEPPASCGVTHSQNNNRKLRDVAAQLIARVSGQPPVPAPNFQRR